jgi:hypothetical protein
MTAGVLEGFDSDEFEAHLAADGARGLVRHARVRIDRDRGVVTAHLRDEGAKRTGRDATPLIARFHGPPRLDRRFAVVLVRPVADGTDALRVPVDHDAEHTGGAVTPLPQIPLVAAFDGLRRLRAAEVGRHLCRVAALERGEIVVRPSLQSHLSHGASESPTTDIPRSETETQ